MNKTAQKNTHYKLQIDIRELFKTFNVGDVVLHAYSTDPFQILKKLKYDAYVINHFKDFSISSILNIKDLVDYKCVDFNPNNFFMESFYEPIFERLFIPPISNFYII